MFLNIIILVTFIKLIYCEELLDLTCFTDADCEQYKHQGHKVLCLNFKCICNDINGMKIKCKPKHPSLMFNTLGKPCPCVVENSSCDPKLNSCFCNDNYTASSDKLRCIKKHVHFNESCEDNSQCIRNDHFSMCDKNSHVCTCQEHYIPHSGTCLAVVDLDEHCMDDHQCNNKTVNSICSDNRCVCSHNFVTDEDKTACIPAADYGKSCLYKNQCRYKLGPGSECYNGKCICDVRHYLSEKNSVKRCELHIDIGDYCKEHNDCYQYHLHPDDQTMECRLGACACRKGFEPDINRQICLTVENASTSNSSYCLIVVISLFFKYFFG